MGELYLYAVIRIALKWLQEIMGHSDEISQNFVILQR